MKKVNYKNVIKNDWVRMSSLDLSEGFFSRSFLVVFLDLFGIFLGKIVV